MPRGRPKKKPDNESGAPAPVAAEKKQPTALEELQKAIARAVAEDPKGVNETLEAIGLVMSGSRRTLEPPSDGRRKVAIRSDELEVPEPVPPAEPMPAVVFKSPFPKFRIVLRRGKKIRFGDDYEIVPPELAEFENGTLRVTDPELVAIMRSKIEAAKKRGLPPAIIEISDEIAEMAKAEVEPVRHEKVTVDTPVDEVLIEA